MFRIELLFIFSFITCHSRILQGVEFKNLGVTNSRGSWVVGRGSWVVGRGSWVQSRGSWAQSRGCKVLCVGAKLIVSLGVP